MSRSWRACVNGGDGDELPVGPVPLLSSGRGSSEGEERQGQGFRGRMDDELRADEARGEGAERRGRVRLEPGIEDRGEGREGALLVRVVGAERSRRRVVRAVEGRAN